MMDKGDGKTSAGKQGRQPAKGGSGKPPASKRTHSDVSPNRSVEEITVLTHHMEELSDDLRSIREDLKTIMKREEMEVFIRDAVTKVVSDFNESVDLMVEIKLEEKLRPIKESMTEIEDENRSLRNEVLQLKAELKSVKKQGETAEMMSRASMAKANQNEQYSRKNNLKIVGINEGRGETEERLREEVCGLLGEKGAPLDPARVLAIHRIPGKAGQPRPVLVRLASNSDKTRVMRKRREVKASGKRLVDDVTRLNGELIKRLLDHRGVDQAWYFNGSVFGKTPAGRRYKFDIHDDIDSVLRS